MVRNDMGVARVVAASAVAAVVLSACGGPGLPAGSKRESGQSSLMDGTFAGKNRCSAESHDRPFVIEWDATDMASFENRAKTDVIFVRYAGCDLEVLDSCSDDSVPGRFGTYAPPQWSSGSVEKIEIANEAELYASLPLGAATLGGRVQGGEAFSMEYFVSGTATATRSEVYGASLAAAPGCAGATHFVYSYNLGAFELKSSENASQEANAGIAGVGAGAKRRTSGSAVKKGGKLASCQGDSAKDSAACRVPIRLTLKPVLPGEDPAGAPPPPPPDAVAKSDRIERANKHRSSAMKKYMSKDGAGCVAEFDAADRLDPDPDRRSTNPMVGLLVRAQCEMLAGKCALGKRHLRQVFEAQPGRTPAQIDRQVSDLAGQFCHGGAGLDDWDRLVAADRKLRDASQKKDAKACTDAYAAINKILPKLPPPDDERKHQKNSAEHALALAPGCAAAGGRCKDARRLQKAEYVRMKHDVMLAEPRFSQTFATQYPMCAGK